MAFIYMITCEFLQMYNQTKRMQSRKAWCFKYIG